VEREYRLIVQVVPVAHPVRTVAEGTAVATPGNRQRLVEGVVGDRLAVTLGYVAVLVVLKHDTAAAGQVDLRGRSWPSPLYGLCTSVLKYPCSAAISASVKCTKRVVETSFIKLNSRPPTGTPVCIKVEKSASE
jgi:hypothetical protein